MLAVSQQEYLNSLKQQQETDTHNKVNNIITSLFFHSVIATVPVHISAESENCILSAPLRRFIHTSLCFIVVVVYFAFIVPIKLSLSLYHLPFPLFHERFPRYCYHLISFLEGGFCLLFPSAVRYRLLQLMYFYSSI